MKAKVVYYPIKPVWRGEEEQFRSLSRWRAEVMVTKGCSGGDPGISRRYLGPSNIFCNI
jgi:hypothetical protein